MPPMRKLCTPVVLAVTLALAPAAAADEPVAQAAKLCDMGDYERAWKDGKITDYVTGKMRVRGVSCKDGRGLIGRWDNCRDGQKDKCKRPGFGFTCKESRDNVISTSFDGHVKCTRGDDLVKFNYTELIT